MMDKSPEAFRTISEVAEDLDLPQHVLRFWETRFSQIKPLKRGGGRRYYRPDDVHLLRGIQHLLYGRGYTIKGVQRILKEEGLRSVQAIAREEQTGEPEPAFTPPESPDIRGAAGDADEPVFLPQADDRSGDPASEAARPQPARQDPPATVAAPPSGLAAVDLARLRQVLDDLQECERVLGRLKPSEEARSAPHAYGAEAPDLSRRSNQR